MKLKIALFVLSAGVIALVSFFSFRSDPSKRNGDSGGVGALTESIHENSNSLNAFQDVEKLDAAAAAADKALNEKAVIASQRMYLAHQPLRLAEVSDPGSKANRIILEKMVFKAMERGSVNDDERLESSDR